MENAKQCPGAMVKYIKIENYLEICAFNKLEM
jgi:hypothetical protein